MKKILLLYFGLIASDVLHSQDVNNQVVGICCQTWMTKNLDVDTYRNGDPIPKIMYSGEWEFVGYGAYCYYDNDSVTYAATYGKLYNWHAVNDPRGLAPEGWHIPTDFEWTTLVTCLGGEDIAGGHMKEIDTTHWNAPNTGATNLSGFTGLPGGSRYEFSVFSYIGDVGIWWSSTADTTGLEAWTRYLVTGSDDITRFHWPKNFGFSVRCIKD